MRARVLYAEKSLPIDNWHYEQLASPEYKGKVCIRSGQHPYNTALIAAMIAHHGEAKTEEWLRGVKANLARKATVATAMLLAISSAEFAILVSPTPITSAI
jgi:iron(III) transport system substrate-binding protein